MSTKGGASIGAGVVFASLLWYASNHGFPWWVEGGLIVSFIAALVSVSVE